MAVYTPLTDDEIRDHLKRYAIGELRAAQGIAEGVENTNYLLDLGNRKYILTLFEKRVKAEDLPYFMALMAWLDERGINCPKPVPDCEGNVLLMLKDKPAVIITFLDGKGVHAPKAGHMPLLGNLAARMHLAARDFPSQRANALSFTGWHELARTIGSRADELRPGLAKLISEELSYLDRHWPMHIPKGPVHGDLFPDNVFFRDGALTGVIDFYFACDEFWMYDLAICLNAWCFDPSHQFVPGFATEMFNAYKELRPFSPEERRTLPVLARGAALRFLLTRSHDLLFHPKGAVVTPKDPMEYVTKLDFFRKVKHPEECGLL